MDLLLLGLGNPGARYRDTRHNVGYLVAEAVASAQGLSVRKPLFRDFRYASTVVGGRSLAIAQPLTYMNNSGVILGQVLRRARMELSSLVVVCDNLDLPPGAIRLKRGGKDAGHNGLKSVISYAGTSDFLRMYIGIGHPGRKSRVIDWVLGVPDAEDRRSIIEAAERAAASIMALLIQSPEQVMNEVNRKN